LRPNYGKQRHVQQARAVHLQRHFHQRGQVTDITYLMMTTNGKRAYLSSIMNFETRDWVAYQIHHRNDIDLVVNTLHKTLQNNKEKI